MLDRAVRSASSLAAALKRGEIGSRELLERYLARVERINPVVNAVVTLDAERARQSADRADAARARGEWLGPLHGLPMTIKDTFQTAGLRTTAGAQVLASHVPARDAVAVERLRAAGAVVFGKTNTPAFAGDVQTYNELLGITRNPWNPARSPGGSSGGAAAAVAAGLTAAELGSDIGGSIRIPAHCCGIYGLKPSHGLIPLRGHIPGPPGTLAEADLAVAGPMGRSAEDLSLLLDVLAGPDSKAAVGWRLQLPPPRRQSLRDYRVAAWLDDPACVVDAGVRASLESAVESLRRAGVRVDERARPLPDLRAAFGCYEKLLWPILTAGLASEEFAGVVQLAAEGTAGDPGPAATWARAASLRHREWLAVNEARAQMCEAWSLFFRDHDVLLCPVMAVPAITHDTAGTLLERLIEVNGAKRPYLDLLVWISLATAALLPAISAPVGRTADGLPVGIQIVGPYLEDRTAIDFAVRLSEVVGGYEPPSGCD